MKRRMVILVSIAMLAIVGGVGCGNETTTAPIQTEDNVPPAAVLGFEQHTVAGSRPSIVLTWQPGAEVDLAGYNVYRATVETPQPYRGMPQIDSGMQLVASVESGIYSDEDVVVNVQYRYAVSARDVSGNESALVMSDLVRIKEPGSRDEPQGRTARG